MAERFGGLIGGTVDRLVRWVVVPVTGVIPFLVSSGILLIVFAAMWLAIGAGLLANQHAVADCWNWLQSLPLPALALAWLLALPVMAGLWVWSVDWPLAVRVLVIAGLAGWNLLVFIPRREQAAQAGAPAR